MIPSAYQNKPILEVLLDILFARFDTKQRPCTHSLWPNIICALSNLFFTGLPAIYVTLNNGLSHRYYLTIGAVLSSTIYHLSEVKSRLPGVPYLRKYAHYLIQLDRFFAIALMIEVLRTMVTSGINWTSLSVGILGLICGVISEYCIGWTFVAWHSAWHNAAFLAVLLL